jgi:uncharacterized membrane protein
VEVLIAFLVLGLLILSVLGPVLSLLAFSRVGSLRREMAALGAQFATLEARLAALARTVKGERPAEEEARPAPRPEAGPVPAVPAAAPPPAAAPRPFEPPPPMPPPSRAPAASPAADFATNLGPRILVAAGALAFVVFLGLFVKYAWESNWVGPTGRVLFGAGMGLALLAGGLRLMGREYRPLGQGLAGAGLAGLYVSAFGAHGFYGLIPREAAGLLMAAITVNAVLLAMKRDARLLAALAWLGAYLTPWLLSTGEDKAVALFAYLALLDAGALVLDRRKPWPETVPLAMMGTLLLYVGWYERFFRPERFEVAAAALVLFTALFALGMARKERGLGLGAVEPLALIGGGMASIALAGATDRPALLAPFLLALAAVAALARRRWSWSEAAGVTTAAAAVLSWFERFYEPDRGSEALTLALTVAGAYLLALLTRGFVLRQRIGAAGVVGHLVTASLAWTVLYNVLERPQPRALGLASLGLAAFYLAIGLAALRERRDDQAQARVVLGLAAAFLTLAIPVQLGLHGITLAWTLEGVLLLGLGVRFSSRLARLGGYGVLSLAVLRLFARHLPLHDGMFRPFANPAFGTWLAVIVALAVAVRLARKVRVGDTSLDGALRVLTGMGSVILLFGLLTAETQATFAQRASLARGAGDAAAAEAAALAGGLAVSVLWTAFATGLLAAGLGLRSRGLFYSGYALFALTSAKVVLWDLATLETLYRMLSFLALGALLLAGAYLNLRFRQRLLPETAAP